MKQVKIFSIGSLAVLLLALAGCVDGKTYGISPWPIYKEPAPLVFDDKETAELMKFAVANPELYKKIQGQSNSYRAIVRTHNKKALEVNKKQLQALGYDEETIKQVYPPKENQDGSR